MKKILHVIAFALALNFLLVAGGAGYLWKSGHLNHDRVGAIKAILFPPPATQPVETVAVAPATQPVRALDALLAKAAGLPAEEQLAFLQHSIDARMAQLDLYQRQLADQQGHIDQIRQNLGTERSALDAEKKQFNDEQQKAATLAGDQGFQDSLAIYSALPAKKVKEQFMGLTDDTIMRYLEAMPPRQAAKITAEFKTPDETIRIQRVLEKMRDKSAGAATQPTAQLPPS